jgi:hypothetical protein
MALCKLGMINNQSRALIRAAQTSLVFSSYLHQNLLGCGSGRAIFKFHHVAKP